MLSPHKRAVSEGSEEWFGSLLQNASDIITLYEADGSIRYVSPAIKRVLGYDPEERIGTDSFELIHPDDVARAKAAFAEALRRPDVPLSIEVRVRHRDGSWRHLEATGTNLLDDPNVRAVVLNSRDVTQRKQTEEKLRQSEERYRAVVEQTRESIYLGTADTKRVLESNAAFQEMLGYTAEELRGMHIYDFVSHDHENIDSVYQSILDEGHRFIGERRYRRKDGSVLDVETSATAVAYDGTQVLCTVVRDVTERKRAEEMRTRLARQAQLRADVSAALAESASLRGTLQRCAEAMVGHLDVAFARIWTLEEENVLELQASAGLYTHLDGAHSRVRLGELKIGRIAQERRPHLTNEVLEDSRVSDKEWARREGMVAFAGYPLVVEDRLVGIVAMFSRQELAEDIIEALGSVADGIAQGIERKRAEEALHRAEARFRALVQNAPDVITIIDTEGTVTYESPSVERVMGYRAEELVGRNGFARVHPDDIPTAQGVFGELLNAPGSTRSAEVRARHRDGSWRHLEVTGTNLVHEAGIGGIVANYRDVTERKRAEESLREANQHLEELANLRADFTAMVAHEIGSPLGAVRGYLEVLDTGELEPAEQAGVLDKIRAEIGRLSIFVADIGNAAAVEQGEFTLMFRRTSVKELLDDAVRFAKTLPGGHPLAVEMAADGRVLVDPYRIGQVLRNLLSNAAKHSPDGALIGLRVLPGRTPGSLRVEVADRGRGVHPDDVERIFEKFGRGRDLSGRKTHGIGLGLYLSRCIVRAHGSDLALDSKSGGGSIFSFELEADR